MLQTGLRWFGWLTALPGAGLFVLSVLWLVGLALNPPKGEYAILVIVYPLGGIVVGVGLMLVGGLALLLAPARQAMPYRDD